LVEVQAPKPETQLAEATALFQSGKYLDARQIAELLLTDNPELAGARRLLDQIGVAEGAVRRERSIVGKLAGADQLLHQRRFDDAIESLKGALAEFGEEIRLRNALENAVAAQKRDQAITRMAASGGGDETVDLKQQKPVAVAAGKPATTPAAPATAAVTPRPATVETPVPASPPPEPKQSRSFLKVLLALVLVAAGGVAGYELWLRSQKPAAEAPNPAARILLEAPANPNAEQAKVVETIDQFLHAVSAGDAEALKSVWPAAPPGTLEAWGSTLGTSATDTSRLQLQALPEVTGRSARVTGEIRAGQSMSPGRKYTIALRKRGEEWQISSVR